MRKFLFALLTSLCVAATYVNDGGTWRQLSEVHINDSGTWRRIQEIYVNDGGTWRSVYVGDVINVPNASIEHSAFSPDDCTVQILFQSNGQIIYVQGTGGPDPTLGNWVTPTTSASGYQIRATLIGGSAPFSGDTLNTWHALTTTRSWTQIRIPNGTTTTNLLVEIRRASDSTVVDSGNIDLVCNVDV